MDPDWACWELDVWVLGYTGQKLEQMYRSWSLEQGRGDSERKKGCYKENTKWLIKNGKNPRPPTLNLDTHIKSSKTELREK